MPFRAFFRHHRQHPWQLTVAVLSLSLGIGAVMSVQGIVQRTLVTPFGAWSSEVVGLRHGDDRNAGNWYTYRDFKALEQRTDVFAAVAAYGELDPPQPVTAGTITDRPDVLMVSTNYFDVCGIQILQGRAFIDSEGMVGASGVAIISQRYALQHFDERGPIGRTILVGDVPLVVVGVAPSDFFGADLTFRPDVFIPLSLMPHVNPAGFEWFGDRSPMWLKALATLQPGLSTSLANSMIAQDIEHSVPTSRYVSLTRAADLRELAIPPGLWSRYETLLKLFMSVSVAILLAATASTASLFFCRSQERARDVMICRDLGASSRRILTQFWLEALIVTAAGAIAGLLSSWVIHAAVIRIVRVSGVMLEPITLDFGLWTMVPLLVVVVGVTSIIGVTAWYIATSRSWRNHRTVGARMQGPGTAVRAILIGTQTACVMALLITSGLLLRSMQAVYATDLGYETDGVVVATVDLTSARMDGPQRRILYDQISRSLQDSLPNAAVGLRGREWLVFADELPADGRNPSSKVRRKSVLVQTIAGDYFGAIGLTASRGRNARVGSDGSYVVVNESFARLIMPSSDVIGDTIPGGLGLGHPKIVGVVPDIRPDPLKGVSPTLYVPIGVLPDYVITSAVAEAAETVPKKATYVVRTSELAAVRSIVRGGIRSVPAAVSDVQTAEHNKRIAGAPQRLGTIAIGVLALTSLSLAMLCLYGLMVGAVTARLREVGVRIALGATSRELVTLFCRDTLLVVVAGIVLGTVMVSYAGHVLRSVLVGVDVADPLTLLVTGLTLAGFAGFTMIVPVLRASRIVPQTLLREH